MSYTPRQLSAFVAVSGRLDQLETARDLSTFATAARGEPREIKKKIEQMQRG